MELDADNRIESPIYDVKWDCLRSPRQEYRHFAGECLRFVAETKDEIKRQTFLEMADAWTAVAFGVVPWLSNAHVVRAPTPAVHRARRR